MDKPTKVDVYEVLKKRILAGTYSIKMRLPTEDALIEEFKASRYAVRQAVKKLSDDGLVYSVKGKGVVLLENVLQTNKLHLNLEKIDDLQVLNSDKQLLRTTDIIAFKQIMVDEELSRKTLFHVGIPVYYIVRIRNVNHQRLALDINYFNARLIPNLTPEIAKDSIYSYIENDLEMKPAVIRRQLHIQAAKKLDFKYLDLKGDNCVGNITNFAFNDDGKQFEYTESHFIPGSFVFNQIVKA